MKYFDSVELHIYRMILWIRNILIAIIIGLLVKNFIFSVNHISGDSMNPTLKEEDRLLTYKIPLHFNLLDRGDIVVIEAPDGGKNDYIKRIIGIPGDKIQIRSGDVYLNNNRLYEEYIDDGYTHIDSSDSWIVADNEIFVMGDNRDISASMDSRHFGCVDTSSVKGIANFRLYPLDRENFGNVKAIEK